MKLPNHPQIQIVPIARLNCKPKPLHSLLVCV